MINKFSNKNNTWIDLNNPTLNDLSFLKKEIFLDDKVLNLILKKSLRDVVYNFENYVYFVFYLPVWDETNQESVKEEISVLVSKNIIVTIRNSRNIVPINELLEDCKKQEVLNEFLGGSIYEAFYYLFGKLFDFCERQLRHIEEKIVKIEKVIFQNSKKSVLKDLVSVKRDLLDFNRIFLHLTLKFNSFCFFVKNLWPTESMFYLEEIKSMGNAVLNNIKNSLELLDYLENIAASLVEEKELKLNRIFTVISFVTWPTLLFLSMKEAGVWEHLSSLETVVVAFVPAIIIYIVLKIKKLI